MATPAAFSRLQLAAALLGMYQVLDHIIRTHKTQSMIMTSKIPISHTGLLRTARFLLISAETQQLAQNSHLAEVTTLGFLSRASLAALDVGSQLWIQDVQEHLKAQ